MFFPADTSSVNMTVSWSCSDTFIIFYLYDVYDGEKGNSLKRMKT